MKLLTFDDAEAAARGGAALIAEELRVAIAARGRACLALSGGRTPCKMMRALASEELSWGDVHIVQTDERVVPRGDPERTLTHLREALLSRVPLRPDHVHPMPVDESDLAGAARRYGVILEQIAGAPAVLDLVHLGLGTDGHTASLVPGDPVLKVTDRDVALSGPYRGHRRMTLTYPLINRAETIVFMLTGEEKAPMLRRLWEGDGTIPAGLVRRDRTTVLADRRAAHLLREDSGEGGGEAFEPPVP